MPITLTPEEIAQLKKELVKAKSAAETFTAQIQLNTDRAAELLIVDNAFKKVFNFYNDAIIGKYDAERKAINGDYIASPIVEADIVACASLAGGRIQPQMPATDVIRISQFDGTPTVNTNVNEQQHITDQAYIEDVLVNGYGMVSYPGTLVTASILNSLSTSLDVSDSTTPLSLSIGEIFVVNDGVSAAVVKINTITPGPMGPPYTATLGITLIVPPVSPISAGENLTSFTGFTDAERASKTASDPALQGLMDYLVDQLELHINNRKARLAEELAAVNTNEDPDAIIELAMVASQINASDFFLTNYLLTTDISDVGLGLLATERSTRSGQLTTRLSQIANNYTGQSKNYYDERYNVANNRANTQRGSLRLQKASLQNITTSTNFAQAMNDQVDAIEDILP